jgi:hypothetical protein
MASGSCIIAFAAASWSRDCFASSSCFDKHLLKSSSASSSRFSGSTDWSRGRSSSASNKLDRIWAVLLVLSAQVGADTARRIERSSQQSFRIVLLQLQGISARLQSGL